MRSSSQPGLSHRIRPGSAPRRTARPATAAVAGREVSVRGLDGKDAPLRLAGISEVHIVRLVALEGRLLRAFSDSAVLPRAARPGALRAATDGYFAGCADVAGEYERAGRAASARAVMECALSFLEALIPNGTSNGAAKGPGRREAASSQASKDSSLFHMYEDTLLEGVRAACRRVSKTLRAGLDSVASSSVRDDSADARAAPPPGAPFERMVQHPAIRYVLPSPPFWHAAHERRCWKASSSWLFLSLLGPSNWLFLTLNLMDFHHIPRMSS